jgi:phosphatidate cytidylyltransferase
MLTRLISGILLLVILAFVLGLGGWILFGFTLLISLIAFRELIRATGVRPKQEKWCMVELVGYLGIIFYYVLLAQQNTASYQMLPIVLTIMGMMLVYVLSFPKYEAGQIMAAAFSYLYAPVFLSFIYQTRMMSHGQYLVWLIFFGSLGCDTCAYAVGMLLGRHKLAPVLSPKKTIEGAVGGVAGAALIGFLYAYGLLRAGQIEINEAVLWVFPLISALGACLSQIGDLAASGIKRNHEIKDYGKLIPGHGGIMDRFDSVIVTAPLIYFGAMLLLG